MLLDSTTLSHVYTKFFAEEPGYFFCRLFDNVPCVVSHFSHSIQQNMSLVGVVTAGVILYNQTEALKIKKRLAMLFVLGEEESEWCK